jgi:hypothetical protein
MCIIADMQKVIISTDLSLSIHQVWELLSNTNHYSRFIAYQLYVEPVGELEEGMDWYDITTILWIPLKINHTVTVFKKHKQLTNSLSFPFNGWMIQDFLGFFINKKRWKNIDTDTGYF